MIQTVTTTCPACGEANATELLRGREHEYENTTSELFPFVKCDRCGLVRLSPRPDVSELSRIYPPDYYAYHLVKTEQAQKGRGGLRGGVATLVQAIKAKRHQRWFEKLVARVPSESPKLRVLDIGCGDGRLLNFYRDSKVGGRIETWGVDMDASSVEIARQRGHHAVHGRFEQADGLPKGTFDLILTSHVIEHVEDPVDFCRRARDLMVPGGLFVVATPNLDSADARYFGKNWGGLHFPRHWTLFDAQTLGQVASSLDMRAARVTYDPNPFFWVWTCHSWCRDRFPGAKWPDRVFPTVSVFHASIQSFFLLGFFTVVELALRTVTGKTGSMTMEIEKPKEGQRP